MRLEMLRPAQSTCLFKVNFVGVWPAPAYRRRLVLEARGNPRWRLQRRLAVDAAQALVSPSEIPVLSAKDNPGTEIILFSMNTT